MFGTRIKSGSVPNWRKLQRNNRKLSEGGSQIGTTEFHDFRFNLAEGC